MIELRGLHLGNIARSPAESVRPDLWPDHAWVPALGRTGVVLYDLCGGKHAALNPAAHEWFGGGLRTIGTTGAIIDIGPISVSGGFTLVAEIMATWSYWAGPCSLLVRNGTGNWPGQGNLLSLAYRSYTVDDLRCTSSLYAAGSLGVSSWGAYIDESTASGAIIADGSPLPVTMGGSVGMPTVPLMLLGGGFAWNVSPVSAGATFGAFLFFRSPRPEVLAPLAADPLLPFRRRVPVYYSVPSGGGSSLAASSAWRVFTAAAIDTSWAIRAALDGSTSWAVLTESGAVTGWRIAAASDADTGWRIAADLDADTAWSLRTAAASPSAWRILAASEADTAWRIAADLNTSTAWAILTSLDAATAWAIISAGTLLANTGWAIRTDADTDTGWRLKTDTAADTAWAVRNARDAATAWDIQAALAGATAWRIKTDLQADTAWTVITDMDADAAWNILRADLTGTAWRVCTDLDTPTSWAVFSDIIPEPVRVFLAPGRQFIINAASRVLIITKTRP